MTPEIGTRKHLRPNVLAWALAGVVLLAGLGLAAARATDAPGFCGGACHEMAPYVSAWDEGPHHGVSCVECHVEPGAVARITHKITALGEVKSHFFGDPVFPSGARVPVPNERCVRCHPSVDSSAAGLDHDLHAGRAECQECHSAVGHGVSEAALRDAGILNTRLDSAPASGAVAVVDAGKANLPGHVTISCSRCHDLARTGCAACHEPRHDAAKPARKVAPCETCHAPGATFAFAHPVAPTCTTCHATPAKHVFAGTCTSCHPKTGVSWAFAHPRAATCESCHAKPAAHASGACLTCHQRRGVSWAFTHPRQASCTSCHARPAEHSSGSCATCHRIGSSWAFKHSSSGKCASCHRAPSNHFGSSCSSCHSPSRAWSSASFSHPHISGGEHTYRSFACASCHPRGYSSASCLKCHDSNSGGDDDD